MKILIVEDNEKTRLELVSSLNKDGYQVQAVDTAPNALKLLKTDKFDFVLSNVDLPGLERAEKLLGDPPLILYTVDLERIASRLGYILFMTKATLEGIKNHAVAIFNQSVENNTKVANSI